jgi:hypothetical protein
MPIDATKFDPIGTFYFFAPPFINPSGLSQQLTEDLDASLLRIRVVPTRPNPNWYQAGILSQLIPGGQIVARVDVPISGLIWPTNPIASPYRLAFYRLRGMRNQTVSVLIDRYTGPDSDWRPVAACDRISDALGIDPTGNYPPAWPWLQQGGQDYALGDDYADDP